MPDYTVISRRILTGTISDLPPSARIAWITVLFEAERLRGKVKLPLRDLAKMASITTPEAAEALRIFQEPDLYSSSKEFEGRRLIAIEGEEDWYNVVTWEKHAEERAAFFNRLRQQRAYAKKRNLTVTHGDSRSDTISNEESKSDSESGKRKKSKSLSAKDLVEGFVVEPKHREWAKEKTPNVSIDAATEKWRDHFRTNGYKTKTGPVKDAAAAWRFWMTNAQEWGQNQKASQQQRFQSAALVTVPMKPE